MKSNEDQVKKGLSQSSGQLRTDTRGDPANRLPKAVARTTPMALFIYSLVVVWFHQMGHQLLRFPFRPWYPKKQEPSSPTC